MNESDMTLGCHFSGEEVIGWLASEKLDGCRAYWDGSRLWTRGGHQIPAPSSFLRDLPVGFALDGEIYAGRGRFEEARQATQYGRWTRRVRFVCFDSPNAHGAWLARLAAVAGRCEVVPHWRVRSMSELNTRLRAIQSRGGEGVVLRDPTVTTYERGRSQNLLKFLSPY